MQSKKHSFLESLQNVAIGYLIAVGSQVLIFPFFGVHVPISANLKIGLFMTIISVCRSYLIRRWNNHKQERSVLHARIGT